MTLEVELLHRVEALEAWQREHGSNHPLEHHDHLMDPEEHAAHHAAHDKPKENRRGERRSGGGERRKSTEEYDGEDRRA